MSESPPHFEKHRYCPVCSSTELKSYREKTFDISTFSEENIKITDSEYGRTWDLARCENCSHVFANPTPSAGFIQSLYAKTEDPEYEEESLGRAKNFQRILTFLERIHPEKGKLLDVGAATGILMHRARQRGWETEGIEPSTWAVEVARTKHDLTLIEGSLETVTLKSSAYTAVTLIDFIEHTAHPVGALSKVHETLLPGGTICLVTPDIQSLAARVMGKRWWHFRPGHLAYFSKKSLLTLLDRTGFHVVRWKRYAWTFSALYLLSRMRFLKFLVKNPRLAFFWAKIPIKLALRDSLEVYARKETSA
jgi:2-polyprenyl-3-methyl-5-hydroxy-6-metoxy-1,4-benzoquinol methylase